MNTSLELSKALKTSIGFFLALFVGTLYYFTWQSFKDFTVIYITHSDASITELRCKNGLGIRECKHEDLYLLKK